MPDRHGFDKLTDVQEAFLRGLTDQRVANMWQAADDWADLSQETRDFLHSADKDVIKWLAKADKDKLAKFDANMLFMDNMAFMNKWLMKGIAVIAVTVTFFIGVYNAWKSR